MEEKYLIITNADMSLQSGNVVLINRRAQEFFKQFNIRTTCIVIKKKYTKCINHNVEGINYIITYNKNRIKEYIIQDEPRRIIFYGVRSYFYINFVKKIIKKIEKKTEVLLDIQGALEEDVEYKKGFCFIKGYIKYLAKKIVFSRAINSVDGVFVVSDELGEYCKLYLNRKKRDRFKICKIRCGINEIISTEQKIQWRNQIRMRWGIDKDTVVMVFSGYRMPWQNINKIIKFFQEFDKKMEKIFFAFFCNLDDNFEQKIKVSFPKDNYKMKFLSFSEYFKYLSACDIGFIVRDNNTTNKVAFPNKFSDYLNAGLMVAINRSLPEPYRILKERNIDFVDFDKDSRTYIINKIFKRQNSIVEYYKKSEYFCKKELLYSTQVRK